MAIDDILVAYENSEKSTVDVLVALEAIEKKPLSEGQKGLWALHKMDPDSPAYNVPVCLHIKGGKHDTLIAAFAALVRQYPLMNSTIKVEANIPYLVNGNETLSIKQSDISHINENELVSYFKHEANIPFQLENETLIRFTLYTGKENDIYLLIVAHHILLDGSSTIIMLDTLLDFYRQLEEGKAIAIDYRIPSYTEFVDWENQQLASQQYAQDREYWKNQLDNLVAINNLPVNHSVPEKITHTGKLFHFNLSPETLQAVDRHTQRAAISKGVFYLTAFKILLFRYTGQEDLIIGMPYIGRPNQKFDRVLGHFVNMLPIRTRFSGGISFNELAASVKANVFEAIDHAALPFTHQVKLLKSHDRQAHSPVFTVSFNYQNMIANTGLNDLKSKYEKVIDLNIEREIYQAGEFDLTLDIIPGSTFLLKYNPELYSEKVITRMAEHFINLVSEILAAPEKTISECEFLSTRERNLLITGLNDTTSEYPKNKTCYDLFVEQVTKSPTANAVVYNDIAITYQDLHQRVIALSAALHREGILPGNRVGVCVNRSIDMIVSLLAIIKSGASYVPLDPDYPAERIIYMLEDSECRCVITQEALSTRMQHILKPDLKCIFVEKINTNSTPDNYFYPDNVNSNKPSVAYVIYTSGSTGKPKGVMVTHQSLTNFIVSIKNKINFSETDSLLSISTYCFDIAGLEIYLPLISGATCIVCDNSTVKDADRLKDAIAQYRPTLIQGTPVTFDMLFRVGWTNKEQVTIFCCGEKISNSLKKLFDRHEFDVWNGYGPTETTIYSTMKHLIRDEPVTIGKPIANTSIYVLDSRQQLVPLGVQGELYIGGDGVAVGYHNRDDLTKEKFVDNPFRLNERMYRTGDLVRWLENGEIELIGRIDNQVKIRGHRIELSEIEERLNEYKDIESSIVVNYKNGNAQNLRAFYLITNSNNTVIDPLKLRQYLSEFLPSYMIPHEFIALEKFPVTPNGKVDRIKLSSMHNEKKPDEKNTIDSTVIKQLRSFFNDVLGHNNFSNADTFFDIGGDSLTAITVVEEINKCYKLQEKVTILFKYSSVFTLGDYLKDILNHDTADEDKFTYHNGAPQNNTNLPLERVSRNAVADSPDYLQDSYAIIGISCELPGAQGHHQFWDNLKNAVESIEFLDAHDLHAAGVAESVTHNPGFIPQRASILNKDKFDPDFFTISPRDAEFMDPQARLLLQHSWSAIEDAGYNVDTIPETAVYISASNNFYQALWPQFVNNMTQNRIMDNADEYVAWILAQGGSIPTLISNKLGLTGSSLFVHSNCSSSLSAIHLACQELASGDSQFALVGASTLFPANNLGYFHQPGLNFSSDGHCKAFDNNADGMVGGEGVASILLRRATDAIRDGDNIYALIRSVAVNNDGAEKAGFYAPGVKGQSRVIKKALDKAGINPETIRFIEAHGTGTKIGDPIELSALIEAYQSYTNHKQYCGIGSVKTNIGHLDTAAGLAGLIKVALSLKHNQIPPTLNYASPNKDIDFDNSPFYVAAKHELITSQKENPLRAAISSFGVGGTNAHAILEKFYKNPALYATDESHLIILSARHKENLVANAGNLLNALSTIDFENNDLPSIAYTLQVGRKPMPCRVAFIVSSIESLREVLSNYLAQKSLPSHAFEGTVSQYSDDLLSLFLSERDIQAHITAWLSARNFDKIAQLWIKGIDIDWQSFYTGKHITRISLPTYSFTKNRYWLEPQNTLPIIVNPSSTTQQPTEISRITHLPAQTGVASIAQFVEETIKKNIIEVLKLAGDVIQYDISFSDYGLDSLAGVKLIKQINSELGTQIDVTRLFDYPTVNTLKRYIVESHSNELENYFNNKPIPLPATSAHETPPIPSAIFHRQVNNKPAYSKEPIAIVGMSGRFPQSDNIEEFWAHLAKGDDLVETVTRWDISKYNSQCTDGGFLKDIRRFDPLFFNISGVEAINMEPQQRIFLEEAWRALEDAGYAGNILEQLKCGVYVGCASGDYINLNSESPYPAQALWGNMNSVIPSRISYFLNLKGPALAVDTACSSSLVALNIACQGLWSNEVDIALAGGIFLQCSPRLYIAGSRAGMLSPTGRCRTFDDAADGFVPAEGVGVLILKKLSRAQEDGDHIYGVIKGIGVNQDGATNGITAPSANSQQELIQQVYADFGIDSESIDMVDAHGTGTKLGDPIEYQALVRAFSQTTHKKSFCALGSSKSNIGHAQMAAGVLGVIKILMAMKYKQIPPTIHYKKTNSNISLADSPFYINTELRNWASNPNSPRRAAISSFGVGGTNAHIVLEEAPTRHQASRTRQPWCILLSARSNQQLRRQAEQLRDYLQQHPALDVVDLSYSLSIGRRHFAKRIAFTADSIEAVVINLHNWLAGNPVTSAINSSAALNTICEKYMSEMLIPDKEIFDGTPAYRIPLPTYPFEEDSYWLADNSQLLMANSGITDASTVSRHQTQKLILEKTIHNQENEKLFDILLTGNEFFLKDHNVQNSFILPGSVYLELAKVAFAEAALQTESTQTAVSFTNIVLLAPLAIIDNPVKATVKITAGEKTGFEIYSRGPDNADITHCRGEIVCQLPAASHPIDIGGMQRTYRKKATDRQNFYAEFSELGIQYGPAFQGFTEAYTEPGAALVKISLPSIVKNTLDDFSVHPILMDCAMQSMKCLSSGDNEGQAQLLFALREVILLQPCSETMWVWIRYSKKDANGKWNTSRMDADLINEQGAICVSIRGIATRPIVGATPAAEIATYNSSTLLPVWDNSPDIRGDQWPAPNSRVAVISRDINIQQLITEHYPNAVAITIPAGATQQDIEKIFLKLDDIDHLVWISPAAKNIFPDAETLIADQETGVYEVFKIFKALIDSGYGNRALGWTFILQRTQSLNLSEIADPTHAGLVGFIGSLAKESPAWQVRSADVEFINATAIAAIFRLQPDRYGNTRLLRQDQWFSQSLLPINTPQTVTTNSRFKHRGVYVIVGGAGGLGAALSEYLITQYQAQVVWLGRRAIDQAITRKIDKLSTLGPKPLYIQTDATSAESLKKAHDIVNSKLGQVHGLIQSAMILSAAPLEKMSELQFKNVYSAKADVSALLIEEFKHEPLDLVLFLSTINSYLKAMAQSNYGAACTFKDAFSVRLSHELPCSVKVINLGYCFNNIEDEDGNFDPVVMADFLNRDEVMGAVESFIASDVKQLTFMKFTPKWSTLGMFIGNDNFTESRATAVSYIELLSGFSGDFDFSGHRPSVKDAVHAQNELLITI